LCNFTDSFRIQLGQELQCCLAIKFFVDGFDTQKKPIATRQRKTRTVEQRVIRHGQAIQPKHSEYSRERCDENRHFKRDRYKRGPAIERTSSNVQRIVDRGDPVLQEESSRTSDKTSDQYDERQSRMLKVQLF